MLVGDAGEARLDALLAVARDEPVRSGLAVLVGSAASTNGDEALGAVFLRAEADLSRQKDAAGASPAA